MEKKQVLLLLFFTLISEELGSGCHILSYRDNLLIVPGYIEDYLVKCKSK